MPSRRSSTKGGTAENIAAQESKKLDEEMTPNTRKKRLTLRRLFGGGRSSSNKASNGDNVQSTQMPSREEYDDSPKRKSSIRSQTKKRDAAVVVHEQQPPPTADDYSFESTATPESLIPEKKTKKKKKRRNDDDSSFDSYDLSPHPIKQDVIEVRAGRTASLALPFDVIDTSNDRNPVSMEQPKDFGKQDFDGEMDLVVDRSNHDAGSATSSRRHRSQSPRRMGGSPKQIKRRGQSVGGMNRSKATTRKTQPKAKDAASRVRTSKSPSSIRKKAAQLHDSAPQLQYSHPPAPPAASIRRTPPSQRRKRSSVGVPSSPKVVPPPFSEGSPRTRRSSKSRDEGRRRARSLVVAASHHSQEEDGDLRRATSIGPLERRRRNEQSLDAEAHDESMYVTGKMPINSKSPRSTSVDKKKLNRKIKADLQSKKEELESACTKCKDDIVYLRLQLADALDRAILLSFNQRTAQRRFEKSTRSLALAKSHQARSDSETKEIERHLEEYHEGNENAMDELGEKFNEQLIVVGKVEANLKVAEQALESHLKCIEAVDTAIAKRASNGEDIEVVIGQLRETEATRRKSLDEETSIKLNNIEYRHALQAKSKELERRARELDEWQKKLEDEERRIDAAGSQDQEKKQNHSLSNKYGSEDTNLNLDEDVRDLLDQLSNEKQVLKDELDGKDIVIQHLEAQVAQATHELQVSLERKREVESDWENIQEEINSQMKDLVSENRKLQEALDQGNRDGAGDDHNSGGHSSEVRELRSGNKELETLVTSLQETCATLRAENQAMRKELSLAQTLAKKHQVESEGALRVKETIISSMQGEIESLGVLLSSREDELVRLEEENANLQSNLRSLSFQIAEQEQDRGSFHDSFVALEQEKSALEVTLADFQDKATMKLQSQEDEISQLKDELNRKTFSTNTERYNILLQDIKRRQKENALLRSELESSEGENEVLRRKIQELTASGTSAPGTSSDNLLRKELDMALEKASAWERKAIDATASCQDWKKRAEEWERDAAEWEAAATKRST